MVNSTFDHDFYKNSEALKKPGTNIFLIQYNEQLIDLVGPDSLNKYMDQRIHETNHANSLMCIPPSCQKWTQPLQSNINNSRKSDAKV